MRSLVMALMPLLAISVSAFAQDTFLTIEDAGDDYRIQGEYTGAIESDGEKVPLGAQVIALGEGK
ncbi:MAG: DUF1080 domain-containing protein, partial [Planctomycetaceae bacterium]